MYKVTCFVDFRTCLKWFDSLEDYAYWLRDQFMYVVKNPRFMFMENDLLNIRDQAPPPEHFFSIKRVRLLDDLQKNSLARHCLLFHLVECLYHWHTCCWNITDRSVETSVWLVYGGIKSRLLHGRFINLELNPLTQDGGVSDNWWIT